MKYFFVLLFFLSACARVEVEKKVDQEAAMQPARSMHGGVASKGFAAIFRSSKLTQEQKEKFMDLHKRMVKDTFSIQDEISRLKGVLFETVTEVPYDAAKVNVLKKKLIQLNNAKMDKMLDALEDVKRIVGYMTHEERQQFVRDMLEFHETKWNK